MDLLLGRVETPIGPILFASDAAGLCALEFADDEGRVLELLRRRLGAGSLVEGSDPHGVGERLRAYFAGNCRAIDAIPVSPRGTPFQREVWEALRGIAAGTTRSYGALAAQLGRPGAARAVGRANALNPISVVIPCHRLVGADSSLTGYGGGIERKRWLLRHEGALV